MSSYPPSILVASPCVQCGTTHAPVNGCCWCIRFGTTANHRYHSREANLSGVDRPADADALTIHPPAPGATIYYLTYNGDNAISGLSGSLEANVLELLRVRSMSKNQIVEEIYRNINLMESEGVTDIYGRVLAQLDEILLNLLSLGYITTTNPE